MSNTLIIKNKIKSFKKNIIVSGDKSISIRWVLFSSLANGISRARNLLMSEDVLASLNAIKKLGIKYKITKKECKIYGHGINGYKYRKNICIDAKNSGTLGRLILGFLINTPNPIKLIGVRPGEKIDETLITVEELSRTINKKNYFIIKPDIADLNYKHYYIAGNKKLENVSDYSSNSVEIIKGKKLEKKLILSKSLTE